MQNEDLSYTKRNQCHSARLSDILTIRGGGLALACAGHGIASTHGDARETVSQEHTDRRDVCTALSRFLTPAMPPKSPLCGPVCRTNSASRAWTSDRFRMCPTMSSNSMRWL